MTSLARSFTAAASAGLLLAGVTATAAPAQADDANTLTVVGTSDVYDSNLVQAVIKPRFEAANPGITLNYVSKGTGAAIDYAKAGTASALLVHAASLENQFVADGYSLEPNGRAVFWGDYVLLGPASDPAGVLGADGKPTDDITAAFQKIAEAGATNDADFVSRGGTPGTTVQEHAIWGTTSGVTTCDVSAANGGGKSPYNGTGTGCAVAGTYPDWYNATGQTQGPNILNGNTCNYPNAENGTNPDCYVFTDRGTFQYLQSTGQAQGLKIVTRSNISTSAAKANLLVNSFHAYAINPAKFDSGTAAGINTSAATKFLDYLTSAQGQSDIGNYLSSGGSDADPPFLPSASPKVTVSALPTNLDGKQTLTIRGSISNKVPGTPALNGVTVKLFGRVPDAPNAAATPKLLDTAVTNTNGGFVFGVAPNRSQTYSVEVPDLTKTERPDLSPVFRDQLTGTTVDIGTTTVTGVPTITSRTVGHRSIRVKGTLSPPVKGSAGRILLYAAPSGSTPVKITSRPLADGATTFDITGTVPSGAVRYYVQYVNNGVIEPGSSLKYTSTIP